MNSLIQDQFFQVEIICSICKNLETTRDILNFSLINKRMQLEFPWQQILKDCDEPCSAPLNLNSKQRFKSIYFQSKIRSIWFQLYDRHSFWMGEEEKKEFLKETISFGEKEKDFYATVSHVLIVEGNRNQVLEKLKQTLKISYVVCFK